MNRPTEILEQIGPLPDIIKIGDPAERTMASSGSLTYAIEGLTAQLNQLALESAEIINTNGKILRNLDRPLFTQYNSALTQTTQYLIETKYYLKEQLDIITEIRRNA